MSRNGGNAPRVFLFNGFRFDRGGGELFRVDQAGATTRVAIGSRARALLGLMVERPNQLISKAEIMEVVWGGVPVDEANLTVQVAALRRVLDRSRTARSLIETNSGRGYRFISAVTELEPQTAQSSLPAPQSGVKPEPAVRFTLINRSPESGPRALSASGPTVVPRLSIVVLPFANLSRDPEQEYYADGIADDLTTDLSRIPGSFVIARSTAFTYKGKSIDVKLIGQELGVRYILEGSVRQARNRIRINVQLIDAESGGHVWADRFETERKNVAEAEDEIIGRLACILKLELVGAAGRQIEHEKALDPDVHDLVMRGWAWYHRPRSKPNLEQAQQAFEQALRADPQSIEAKVGLATVMAGMVLEGCSQSLSADQARIEELLTEVFAYSANHSMAHYAMAMLRRSQKRLSEARIAAERAVILDHNHSAALCELGLVHLYLGHPAAAIAHIEKAIRLSPRDPFLSAMHYGLGRCHLFLGHLDEAITLFEQVRTERPAYWDIHMWLAGALAVKGDLDGARIELAEARRLKPEINSLNRWRKYHPWITSPQYRALRETTLYVGLRRAGLPENDAPPDVAE